MPSDLVVPALDQWPELSVRKAARKLARLPLWKRKLWSNRDLTFSLQGRIFQRHGTWSGGRAWSGGSARIHLSIGPRSHAGCVTTTLIHEMAHLATPGEHHGLKFRHCFVQAVQQAFDLDLWKYAEVGSYVDLDKRIEGTIEPFHLNRFFRIGPDYGPTRAEAVQAVSEG